MGGILILAACMLSSCGGKEVGVEYVAPVEMAHVEDLDLGPVLEVTNPVDFATLQKENPDVYAYLVVPGTVIDYPVLQSGKDKPEDYYLMHNLDLSAGFPGCVYSQQLNRKDFKDTNTILYGHNMLNGSYFHDLHRFRDPEFFAKNRSVYIYTPEEVLEYEVVAAYIFTDDHLLYRYDMFTEDGYAQYLQEMASYAKRGCCVEDLSLSVKDRLLTLSTCTDNESTRLLVQSRLLRRTACPAGETVHVSLWKEDE